MLQLIVFIIFLISVVGILLVLYRKVPALVSLPRNGHHGFKKPQFIARIEKKIKAHHFHFFEKQMLLHKILSFTKVWTLKIETHIDAVLHGIRKKAQELDKEVKKKK